MRNVKNILPSLRPRKYGTTKETKKEPIVEWEEGRINPRQITSLSAREIHRGKTATEHYPIILKFVHKHGLASRTPKTRRITGKTMFESRDEHSSAK